MRPLIAALVVLVAEACTHRHPAPRVQRTPPPAGMSGFLDDYALLREAGPDDLQLVYRNPQASWTAYDKVLLAPVTLWRSGHQSLGPVPREDLLRLVSDFQEAVRTRLGESFRFVDQAGPGVMRIHIGITDARDSDPVLDILTASRGTGRPHPAGDGPLHAETASFLAHAVVEGEIRDAETNALLAAGLDGRRPGAPALETWADVRRTFASWIDRMCTRLEARTRVP